MQRLSRPLAVTCLQHSSAAGVAAAAAAPLQSAMSRSFTSSVSRMKVAQETMRAVKIHAPMDYRLHTVPVPKPRPGELLMKVEAAGICASDLKAWHGTPKFWGVDGDPERPRWIEPGITPGHEIVGSICEGDPDTLATRGLTLGERVTVEQIIPCKVCRYCESGNYHMCMVHDMFGMHGFDGGMAEYMLIPARALVHKISPNLAPHHAAFVEPLSCSLHAVERANIQFNDTVVVAGCGPLGLGCVIGAAAKGALNVVALDMDDTKLELAKQMGANYTLNIKTDDALAKVKELTHGHGCDVYVEASGHPSAVTQGLTMLRRLGTFLEYSVFKDPVSCDWSIISDDKALTIYGAHLGPHCWPHAVKLLEKGDMPLEGLCTHQFPLEKWEEAFKLVGDSQSPSVKVSIVPSMEA